MGKESIDVFAVIPDEGGVADAFRVMQQLRAQGLSCDMNLVERSLKAQMKQANRDQAKFDLIFGEDEQTQRVPGLSTGMADSSQTEVKMSELETFFK